MSERLTPETVREIEAWATRNGMQIHDTSVAQLAREWLEMREAAVEAWEELAPDSSPACQAAARADLGRALGLATKESDDEVST